MFNRLLSKNRVFIALVLAVVFVASGLLYLNTVNRQATRDIQRTQERVNAPKPPPPGETAESGHWHGDEWHAEPHETPSADAAETRLSQPSQRPDIFTASEIAVAYQALRAKYPKQTNNPPPFEDVPVDLHDFEATKTAYIDHFNFYVEHYDPEQGWSHTHELRIASAIMSNIRNAAYPTFGLWTRAQCDEIREMHRRYFDFKGVKALNITRVKELLDQGYSITEARNKASAEAREANQ
ncbi:MAG: hypothetical protein OXN25_05340 [Candidatus Poribacteria bacterium]|nr:hypothetical protein [Candidatus Poribacteria bacterium]